MTNLRIEAEKAWQRKDYKKYVELLDDVQNRLAPVGLKKLNFSKLRKE